MIEARGVGVRRDGRPVLDDVSLSVAAGETLVVMGPNGAGKTTLLTLLAGLEAPDAGSVEGPDVVGFAPEDPRSALFAESVAEEVAFFPRNRGLEASRRAEAAMDALGVTHLRDRGPHALSVGEQRRVSIAAVLAGDPDAAVLDEPTRGLDRAGERELAARLRALDATLVCSTHDAEFALDVADRVAVLVDGGLRRVDDAHAVLTDEAGLEAAGIRPPGAVSWARRRGLDPPPLSLAAAAARLEGEP